MVGSVSNGDGVASVGEASAGEVSDGGFDMRFPLMGFGKHDFFE